MYIKDKLNSHSINLLEKYKDANIECMYIITKIKINGIIKIRDLIIKNQMIK